MFSVSSIFFPNKWWRSLKWSTYVPRNVLLTSDCQRNHPMNYPCNSHSLNNHFSFVFYVVVSAPKAPFPNRKKKQKQQEMKIEEAIWGGKKELDLPANRKTSNDAINKNSWGKVDVRHVPWLNLRPRFVHSISINAASLGISFCIYPCYTKLWIFKESMEISNAYLTWFLPVTLVSIMCSIGNLLIDVEVSQTDKVHLGRFFFGYTLAELNRGIIQNDLINSDSS